MIEDYNKPLSRVIEVGLEAGTVTPMSLLGSKSSKIGARSRHRCGM